MIIGLGKINTKAIIDDMILMARGLNQLHERNPEHGHFKHSDGWGLAYLNHNSRWVTYKSINAIYDDKNLVNFRTLKTEGLIIHVRRATKGIVSFDNTQPFYLEDDKGEYIFTHNGTIHEDIKLNSKIPINGNSDSLWFFKKIYSDFVYGDLKYNPFYPLKDFSSANFFLATPEKFYIGSNFSKYPDYYTMNLLRDSEKTIISSEILPTMKDKNWISIRNGALVEINRR